MIEKERPQTLPVEKLLAGILAMIVADRDDRLKEGEPRRSDVILAEAGFSIGEIATLTGRKYETVKSALRRSRAVSARGAKASTEED